MDKFGHVYEQFRVAANDLADKVSELIHEGNVRRIIIRNEQGHTFMEIPLTVAAIGVILAPVLAAVGAIAAVASKFEIVVERAAPAASAASGAGASPPHAASDASTGATEDRVNMSKTVPQHSDRKGTKLEDLAGTGEHDSQGG